MRNHYNMGIDQITKQYPLIIIPEFIVLFIYSNFLAILGIEVIDNFKAKAIRSPQTAKSMTKKWLKYVVCIIIFIFMIYVIEWIFGFIIIGIAVISKSYGFELPWIFMHKLGFPVSLVCSFFATRKLVKHRRVQAFINADSEEKLQVQDEKKN